MGGGLSLPADLAAYGGAAADDGIENTELYTVRIYSGKHVESGWSAAVAYQLVGETGMSAPQRVSGCVEQSLTEEGFTTMEQLQDGTHREEFSYAAAEDLGDIGCVVFTNQGAGAQADWEVHKVVVEKIVEGGLENGRFWKQWVIPCYGWVPAEGRRHFFEAQPRLPRHTPFYLQEMRARELEDMQRTYLWETDPINGLPISLPNRIAASRLEDLPRDERPPELSSGDLAAQVAQLLVERGLSHLIGDPSPWKLSSRQLDSGSLMADGAKLSGFPAPSLLGSERAWIEDDHEFARQLLQGCNPSMLTVCTQLPEELDMAYIQKQLELMEIIRPGRQLEAEALVGRCLLLDLRELRPFLVSEAEPGGGPPAGEGGGSRPRKFAGCAPLCLLYLAENETTQEPVIVPAAIKLQPHDDDAPTFTPNCYEYDWLIAKTFVANADAQLHVMKSLYLEAYAVMEPFAVALQRRLSALHPVFRLLRPHLRHCIAANVTARRWLTGPAGLLQHCFSCGPRAEGLVQHMYSKWSVESMGMPQNLLARGFDGSDALVQYPFRDDGMLVWGAIVDFVIEYLGLFYTSDYEVASDEELQGWWKESIVIGHNSLIIEEDSDTIALRDFDQLCMICSIQVWNNTAWHSAISHSCYEFYAFPANRPTILHLPPIHRLDAGTAEKYELMLPSKGETVLIQGFMTLLAEIKDHSMTLGAHDGEWFTDAKTIEVFERFRANLIHIEAIIQVRNERREVPYPYMQPGSITMAVGT
eukprot:jgi/Tetstr1/422434/TSEL_013272.t1